MQFLLYGSNENLEKVHLDNNSISELVLPKSIAVLTMAFNRLDNLDKIALEISRNSSLENIDLSFNPVKKLYNYKY
jgi:Leucine-rich repeat (LRR) protein